MNKPLPVDARLILIALVFAWMLIELGVV